MSAELKPCPFCGEVPGVAPSGYVFCMSPHDCPAVQIGTSVEQWNTRAPSPDLDRLRGENERLRAMLLESKRKHYSCEDGWYACPQDPDCDNYAAGEPCNCGADAWNSWVDALLASLSPTEPRP